MRERCGKGESTDGTLKGGSWSERPMERASENEGSQGRPDRIAMGGRRLHVSSGIQKMNDPSGMGKGKGKVKLSEPKGTKENSQESK